MSEVRSYTGTAPIDVSSGDVVRQRLSRAGDRQLNYCLHVMATSQIRHDTPGRNYYLRKRSQGKGHNEAMRCLKPDLAQISGSSQLAVAQVLAGCDSP